MQRLGHGLLGSLAAGVAIWLAMHYPLGSAPALGVLGLLAIASALWPSMALVCLPALLPWVGGAPWTGWLSFEEFDALALAVVAGAGWRVAIRPRPVLADAQGWGRVPLRHWLVILWMAASVVWSLQRGLADAGGFAFGWTQGYREPMNSIRLAKPFVLALLWWPLWREAAASTGKAAARALELGLSLGLCGVALACLWERWTYTDLLNFSTDYRTTALFWEMHVGGAALDAVLAMMMPFGLLWLLRAQGRLAVAFAWAVMLVSAYAALTTFSRIVYAVVPMALALVVGLHAAQRLRDMRADGSGDAASGSLAFGWIAALCGGFGLGAVLMFPTSGYRGLLALWGLWGLMLLLGARLHELGRRGAVTGLGGAALAVMGVLAVGVLPKGPYVADALVVGGAGAALLWATFAQRRGGVWPAAVGLAGCAGAAVATVQVAGFWGGAPAAGPAWAGVAVGAAVMMAAAVFKPAGRGAWPARLPWMAGVWMTCGLLAILVGIFGGGDYMRGRMASSGDDRLARLNHWQLSLSWLRSAEEVLLGKGLGRYLDSYALSAPPGLRPGDVRWVPELGHEGGQRNGALSGQPAQRAADGVPATQTPGIRMVAGDHVQGPGEILRLSQRIARPTGPLQVRVQVRAHGPVMLHAEVCIKHLLYEAGCWSANGTDAATTPGWRTLNLALSGEPMTRSDWAEPRFVVFSLATEQHEPVLEIRAVSLVDAQGHEYLLNPDFQRGLERWFITSDRYHMPWHAKGLAVHLLVEQGLLGLTGVALATLMALGALTLGRSRDHPLAPALAAALVGFWGVGSIDSLLDMPRVATLFYLLLLIALGLPRSRGTVARSRPSA